MEQAAIFEEVKKACGIVTNYQDNIIRPIFNDVIYYMKDAGVPKTVLESEEIIGVAARGVTDLYFTGQGLSNYFKERVIQLALTVQKGDEENV